MAVDSAAPVPAACHEDRAASSARGTNPACLGPCTQLGPSKPQPLLRWMVKGSGNFGWKGFRHQVTQLSCWLCTPHGPPWHISPREKHCQPLSQLWAQQQSQSLPHLPPPEQRQERAMGKRRRRTNIPTPLPVEGLGLSAQETPKAWEPAGQPSPRLIRDTGKPPSFPFPGAARSPSLPEEGCGWRGAVAVPSATPQPAPCSARPAPLPRPPAGRNAARASCAAHPWGRR